MSPHSSSGPSVSEHTPLLSRHDEDENYDGANGDVSTLNESLHSDQSNGKKQTRWATYIALTILCLAVLAILGVGFAAPAVVQEYAKEALVVEPNKLSIDSFTGKGIRARIQASCYLDASRVRRKSVRDLGRLSTWIVKEIESGDSTVDVYLLDYGNVLLGRAKVPPVKINVRNGHRNHFDFLTDLEPGVVDGAKKVANDWLDGKLGSLSVRAVAKVPLKTGLINLGIQTISQELHLQGHELPKLPEINIDGIRVEEYGPPGHPIGMKAMAKASVMNDYPITFDVPSLRFDVLLRDCDNKPLTLADATTEITHILPRQFVNVTVSGMVHQLPTSLTTACPDSNVSPLDSILANYLQGKKTWVYVRGGDQDIRTPDWITEILRGTVVPIPLPSHPFDNLIKSFSLANVHFTLPDPSAEPDTPEAAPRISATVKALVALPKEISFNLGVDKVKADADVYYQGKMLGKLDLRQWQNARTSYVDTDLLIESDVDDAPLDITDGDVFTEVIQGLLFGKGVQLDVHALVDVNTLTALGEFVVRKLPADGKIFIKSLGQQGIVPSVGELKILSTLKKSITLSALINVTNPTEYSAHVPYVNVSILHNDTIIGYASAMTDVVPGLNSVAVIAEYQTNPVGKELLSQILSGWNTTLTVRTHAGSIPSQPKLGEALSGLEMVFDTPKLFGSFLKEATMHVFSSTATFILISPVSLFITQISATAFYNGTEVGTIDWNYPFLVDEGESTTPKLPVVWKAEGLGAVRDALGGTLKLDAKANVGVKIGVWKETVWYEGGGIGAKIRL